jgi:hypothetical protein
VTETVDVEPITVDLDALGLGPEDPDKQKAAAESIHRTQKRRLQEALETVKSVRTQAAAALTALSIAGGATLGAEPIEGSSAPEGEPGPGDIEGSSVPEEEPGSGDAASSFTAESRVREPDAVIDKRSSKERQREPDAVIDKRSSKERHGK